MPKIYLCPDGPHRICTIVSKEKADLLLRQDPDWDVYVLDVEKYAQTSPKETRWTVVGRDGDSLHRNHFISVDPTDDAVSFNNEHDAICMLDILVRGGMTGLKIVKIEEE